MNVAPLPREWFVDENLIGIPIGPPAITVCEYCNGVGRVFGHANHPSDDGGTCPDCDGAGAWEAIPCCPHCDGDLTFSGFCRSCLEHVQ